MSKELYKIVIVPKADIIKTIQENVTDGEILNDIISSLEDYAKTNIQNLKHVSLPYIGTIKPDLRKCSVDANYETLKNARDTKTKAEYLVFKRNLTNSELIRIKAIEKVDHYMEVGKSRYKDLYEYLCSQREDFYPSMVVFLKCFIKPVKHGLAELGHPFIIEY